MAAPSCDEEISNLRLPPMLCTVSAGAATSADDTVEVVVVARMPTPEPSRSRRRKKANPMKLSELTSRGALETTVESPQLVMPEMRRNPQVQPSYSLVHGEESPVSVGWDDCVDDSADYVVTVSEVSDEEDQVSEDHGEDWVAEPAKKVRKKAAKSPRKPRKKRPSARTAARSKNATNSAASSEESQEDVVEELEGGESGAAGILGDVCQESVAEVELVAEPLPVAAAAEPSTQAKKPKAKAKAKAKAAANGSDQPHGDPRKTQRAFQCPRCWRSFVDLTKWQKHIDYHDSPMPYKCDTCEKRFRQPGNLKMHNRVHTGEKPYNCGFCDKSFRFPSELSSHQRKHWGLLPDCCSICGSRFKDGGTLRRHMLRQHKEQSQNIRVRCKKCKVWFSTRALLDEHVCRPGNTGHSLACPICRSEFSTAEEMQAHDCVKKQEAYPSPAAE